MNTISFAKNTPSSSIKTSLSFITTLAQCFGLFPLQGVLAPKVRELKFSWKSGRTILSCILIAGNGFFVFMCIFDMAKKTYVFADIVRVLFYAGTLCTAILFLMLARDWPRIMREWSKVDFIMERNYGYPKTLNGRLFVTAIAVLIFATTEVLLSFGHRYLSSKLKEKENFEAKHYFLTTFPFVFHHCNYSVWMAIWLQIVYMFSMFAWTYNDLFVMIIGSALAIRFKQITMRLKAALEKNPAQGFWSEIREDYDRLCKLCKIIDDSVSKIIFLSFSTNLLLLLSFLYHCTKLEVFDLTKCYYIFALTFVTLRTTAVSLYASWINDESKEPATVLNSVPTSCYNLEIRRFLLQISFDNVTLTGWKTFKITRGLILNVAGIIVTYELVVVQFFDR